MPGNSRPPYDSFNLGLRSGEAESLVRANRALLERALQLPSSPRWLQQVHGDRSLRVTEEVFDGEQQADAAFTTQSDIVLAILTADCLPILLCADDGSEIGAIHAGWRGLSAGIVESTIARLRTPRCEIACMDGTRDRSGVVRSRRRGTRCIRREVIGCDVGIRSDAAWTLAMRFVFAGAAETVRDRCRENLRRQFRYAGRCAFLFIPPRRRAQRTLRQPDLAEKAVIDAACRQRKIGVNFSID